MTSFFKYFYAIVFSFLMSGCTEMVTLSPAIHTGSIKSVGKGESVILEVVDARGNAPIEDDHLPLGTNQVFDQTSHTTQVVYKEVEKGLISAGFKPVDYSKRDMVLRKIIISLDKLKYKNIAGFFSIESTISVKVINNGIVYQNSYKASKSDQIILWETHVNERLISGVLSENISKIFYDRKLMSTLAK